MKNKNETVLNIFAANNTCTRREVLHRFAVTACAAAVPAFVAACGGGSGGSSASGYNISFEVTFSKPMDTATVENAISITPAGADMDNAEITWSQNNTVLYYKTEVSSNTTYSVVIQETAADTKGRLLDSDGDYTGGGSGDGYTFNVPAV